MNLEPLPELLNHYDPEYHEIFAEIVRNGAENNRYPVFQLAYIQKVPELICPFLEGFEKYLFNMSFRLSDNCLYIDQDFGSPVNLTYETKLFIFENSDELVLRILIGKKYVPVILKLSNNANLLLEKYQLLITFEKCANRCSINKKFC